MEGRSSQGQCPGLSRKETESVGKDEEEEAKGVGGFKSRVSVGIYFRVIKELAEAIFDSLVLYFL